MSNFPHLFLEEIALHGHSCVQLKHKTEAVRSGLFTENFRPGRNFVKNITFREANSRLIQAE